MPNDRAGVADGVMDVLFVVSRDEPWRYEYLKDLQTRASQ